jgi:hypothetical protein
MSDNIDIGDDCFSSQESLINAYKNLVKDNDKLRSENYSLRHLINAWVDADDDPEDIDGPYHAAWLALRKAVGR